MPALDPPLLLILWPAFLLLLLWPACFAAAVLACPFWCCCCGLPVLLLLLWPARFAAAIVVCPFCCCCFGLSVVLLLMWPARFASAVLACRFADCNVVCYPLPMIQCPVVLLAAVQYAVPLSTIVACRSASYHCGLPFCSPYSKHFLRRRQYFMITELNHKQKMSLALTIEKPTGD